jgi:hypothetical protein
MAYATSMADAILVWTCMLSHARFKPRQYLPGSFPSGKILKFCIVGESVTVHLNARSHAFT